MIKEAVVKIVNKEDLTYDEAYTVMNEIMGGETTATQNAAFLAALSTKSARAETTDEIAGCAAAMRAHATKVETGMELFEIVGTGGDNAHSFNISTTSAIVAAAGGMKVAKHGNRAASSLCGTADCLEALGCFESRSRRINTHNRTVQQRLLFIFLQHIMVFPTLTSDHQMRIKIRCRYQT